MSGLGVHFGLDEDEAHAFQAAGDPETLRALVDDLEDGWDEGRLVETDEAWEPLHRAFGEGPLSLAILGGEVLPSGPDFHATLRSPAEVQQVAQALDGVTEAWLRPRFEALGPDRAGPPGDEGFEYAWDWLLELREFYRQAAAEGWWVLFTAEKG